MPHRRVLRTRSGREITLRVATPADAEGVLHVRRETAAESLYTVATLDELSLDVERERETIRQSAEEPGWLHLVAESDGGIIGYLEFTNGSRRRARHCGIFSVYLLDGWRGDGIGHALVSTLLEWAEAHPVIEKVTLAVFSSNTRARALYERCGFVVEGYCPRDMKLEDGTYLDSVLMYRMVTNNS